MSDPTARTLRLVKAEALREAAETFKSRFEDKGRVLQPGYLTAEYELIKMAEELEKPDPCPYDFAHTRHWCGHPDCRES